MFHYWKLTQNYFKKHQFCSHNIYMSHQLSIVLYFFSLNVQVLQENCWGKVVPLVKTNTKLLWKTTVLLKKHKYESPKVNCTSFFPLNVQVLEKNFFWKSCFISENSHKTTFKNTSFGHNTYIWVIKAEPYIIFSS